MIEALIRNSTPEEIAEKFVAHDGRFIVIGELQLTDITSVAELRRELADLIRFVQQEAKR